MREFPGWRAFAAVVAVGALTAGAAFLGGWGLVAFDRNADTLLPAPFWPIPVGAVLILIGAVTGIVAWIGAPTWDGQPLPRAKLGKVRRVVFALAFVCLVGPLLAVGSTSGRSPERVVPFCFAGVATFLLIIVNHRTRRDLTRDPEQ